jgi:hypothetical protein
MTIRIGLEEKRGISMPVFVVTPRSENRYEKRQENL